MASIELYCDGGCRGNGTDHSVGGYGVVMMYGQHKRELKDCVIGTTNNRMELLAAIEGLRAITDKTKDVVVYTDSAYVCNCIVNGWYKKWRYNGWRNSKNEPVPNKQMWVDLLNTMDMFRLQPVFKKVKGHSDNEYNNRADALANEAMDEGQREYYGK